MSKYILIFGQPGVGKTSSLKNLDPASTIIIDADAKNGLPWKGWKKYYSQDKGNYFTLQSKKDGTPVLDRIISAINTYGGKEEFKHIKTLVIDGFNNAMLDEKINYKKRNRTNNTFEIYQSLRDKIWEILQLIKSMRDDLTIVLIAHVETADPYVDNDTDHMFSPGKVIEKEIKVEGQFLYVFYAKAEKSEDGKINRYFETLSNKSTARAPEGCFTDRIPLDIAAAIKTITDYENGDDNND